MTLILSLGRSRVGAFFAWLAVVSLGALAVARDPASIRTLDGAAQFSLARTLIDAPAHVIRIAAVKPAPHYRTGEGDRRNASGPDPVLLPLAVLLAARAIGFKDDPIEFIAGAILGRPVVPYAARAPPQLSI